MAALLRGKCMEVKNGSDEVMERSSLLVGLELEEGTTTTVAVIMLPIHMQSRQHQTLQRFVEMAKETAESNGSGKLQIVCARKVELDSERSTTTEEEERAEKEGIRQILLSLPKGSCAILSSECKRVKILTYCLDRHDCVGPTGPFLSNVSFLLSFFIANVGVDRKNFESLKFIEDEISGNVLPPSHPPAELWKAENKQMRIIQNFIKSICPEHEHEDWDVADIDGQCQSESKTREFIEALKGSGIHYLLIHYNTSKVVVDDLHGKAIGFFICNFEIFECIKLHQIYEDLQQMDSNFIWIWIPSVSSKHCGHGSYTRFIQCMPWATFTDPQLVNLEDREPCFVLLDKHGQIANHDALPLLLAWGVKSYPFTPHTIPESLSLIESGSCLEFLLHGMNIVGRKQMKRKMTFLYVEDPLKWLQKKSKLEVLTQIDGNFEVLYVGKFYKWGVFGTENVKQEYETATQNMRWPSLSFSDMIKFWYRCQYLANEEAYLLYKESNIMMKSLYRLANHLCGQWDYDDTEWLVLGDNNGVVTCDGYEVVQMICESSDEIWEGEGMGMRMVKDELILSLNRGECSPLVRTFFRDEIHNYPQHRQHPIEYLEWEGGCLECDVCGDRCIQKRTYWCGKCSWFMCGSCWMAYAKQEVQQMLCAKEN